MNERIHPATLRVTPTDPRVIHGQSVKTGPSKKYTAWRNIKARCHNPNDPAYKNYGARGITLYTLWHDFETFDADIPDASDPNLTIDRIDNNGNYEPGNVRWATRLEQSRNRRENKPKNPLSYQGRENSLFAWCRELNLNYQSIYTRVKKGMQVEEAFALPTGDFKTTQTCKDTDPVQAILHAA